MKKVKEPPELQALKKYQKELKRLVEKYRKKAEAAHAELVALRVDYPDEESISDAWAYDLITDDQRRALLDDMEQEVTQQIDVIALSYIKTDYAQISAEIQQMQWEILPAEEQERIRRSNEDYHTRIRAAAKRFETAMPL